MSDLASDPAVASVLRESASRLAPLGDQFVRHLHADLGPLTADLAGEGWPFCDRMVRTLLWAPVTDQPFYEIASALRWVGGQNRMEGFPDERYTDVVHAVVQSVRTLISDQWSTPMGSAWIGFFLWIRPHLIVGAQQAAQDPAVAEAGDGRPGHGHDDVESPAARPQGLTDLLLPGGRG